MEIGQLQVEIGLFGMLAERNKIILGMHEELERAKKRIAELEARPETNPAEALAPQASDATADGDNI